MTLHNHFGRRAAPGVHCPACEEFRREQMSPPDTLEEMRVEFLALAERAWGVIANVSEGRWHEQTPAWNHAAQQWRDNYFEILEKHL